MKETRLEFKVGLFVLLGLALLVGLLLSFSKGITSFRKVYTVHLQAANAGGLKERAVVLMSGVQIGTVYGIALSPESTNVTITLRIYSQYKIHKPARFLIEQSGFLGDQFVAIMPASQGPTVEDGDTVTAEEPFDLQEVARSAVGFIKRVDETAKDLNDLIAEVRREVLNEHTMTNLALTVGNARLVSERALTTVDDINALLATNGPALNRAGTNIEEFSEQLKSFAADLSRVLETNSTDISAAVKNVESSTETLKTLVEDVQAGKGLAGTLLKDPRVAAQVSEITYNLSVTTSNLNRLGLWHILWQHKPPRTNAVPARQPLQAPKSPPD
jgi:phospholipid/cholesterol/gamma-HCH transport system substrate-binding protein